MDRSERLSFALALLRLLLYAQGRMMMGERDVSSFVKLLVSVQRHCHDRLPNELIIWRILTSDRHAPSNTHSPIDDAIGSSDICVVLAMLVIRRRDHSRTGY